MFHRGGLHVQAYVGGCPGQHRFGLRHIGSGAAFQSGDQAPLGPKPAGGAADSQARQIRSNRQARDDFGCSLLSYCRWLIPENSVFSGEILAVSAASLRAAPEVFPRIPVDAELPHRGPNPLNVRSLPLQTPARFSINFG
jgi:hypothetical protein